MSILDTIKERLAPKPEALTDRCLDPNCSGSDDAFRCSLATCDICQAECVQPS